ncbi:sugar-binding domain-containing protein [Ilyobacter sp.]|uniref:sugar-binding domain-containing protein n=1 Tax=Ilyobacter sp. TaxID=3100343 RepID=UPI00356ADF1F
MGIVKITITSPLEQNEELLKNIKEAFNLKGGIIVHGAASEKVNNAFITNESSIYIIKKLKKANKVGLGWGKVINSVVKRIIETSSVKTSGIICPLLGNSVTPYEEYHPDSLVRKLGEKLGLQPFYIYSPTFFESKEEFEGFSNLENQKIINDLWSSLDIAILNIDNHPSVPDFATASRFGESLHEKKIIGHMISYYYNIQGEILNSPSDYTNHISLSDLKKIETVIGVCSSDTNAKSVIGALKTGLITHLIIDDELATKVLEAISK